MRILKLDATDSTNSYLKQLTLHTPLENFTVVTAAHQTHGRGQRGASWQSETGKDLIMSVLVEGILTDVQHVFALNVAVALSVLQALRQHQIPDVAVKWPNDIMAGNKKLGGILIENVVRSQSSVQSIVGIGINVNQTDFHHLPQASSLKLHTGRDFDISQILITIVEKLKQNSERVSVNDQSLWQEYNDNLFCRGVQMSFLTPDGRQFTGIILQANSNGLLKVQTQDGVVSFDVKDVQLLY